ncbi:DUF4189 domain-containing protein [Nocardia amikacinitolerans]|uniref:DUF4189 domain-containing protein n=1 Tax=Nocardia amikacinitolerans TaxID=756689 RepID=UPI0020A2FA45|nr:DUF4189 domain-containing protein [Nocardia amikacinitolerans]MCP2277603.1 protein of unknown function (DUF4189) [Nocardia amikacinitolerans]MCP2298995.1 protein of unknown function (DUF4189) [Nocardia amikacinitolerans]
MKKLTTTVLRVTLTAAIAGTLLGVSAGPAAADQDKWGAIAYSPSTGATGGARNYSTKARAERAAVDTCDKSDCRVMLNFVNKCGAVARASDNSWSWGRGPTRADATANAIGAATGRNPQIKQSVCTD